MFPKFVRVPKIEEHKTHSDKIPDKQTTGRHLDCIYSWNFYWVEMRRMGCIISRGTEPDLGLSLGCWVTAVGAGPGSRPAPLQLRSAPTGLYPRGWGSPVSLIFAFPALSLAPCQNQQMTEFVNQKMTRSPGVATPEC